MMPSLIIFDMDGTLARSKEPIEPSMAALLAALLLKTRVAIISGGEFARFSIQVIERLPEAVPLARLSILPTSGAQLYEWQNGAWERIYEERISENDVPGIEEAIRRACKETGIVDFSSSAYGERIEYRGGQVTLSALGQAAPIEAKEAWDPDKKKRHALREAIARYLPRGFTVTVGGKSSIDITKEGVDKAYGIRQLSRRFSIPESAMLYVGDELEAGGNDEPAYKTDVRTHAVNDPKDTETFIINLLGATEA